MTEREITVYKKELVVKIGIPIVAVCGFVTFAGVMLWMFYNMPTTPLSIDLLAGFVVALAAVRLIAYPMCRLERYYMRQIAAAGRSQAGKGE